ncbi:uncharacterized protein H6S33_006673 [Morchella sextelata]|uniref:uncharacterized protein n=1 Tax=Morchella sextelata TaxID=1174677 RepID=UPI001D0564D2|nr:uncharacterized protein H6S33_006673 [Morchella sextelata]KAH0604296.1 hypothetical protein H6S33_006673 [Morchella sextelata]
MARFPLFYSTCRQQKRFFRPWEIIDFFFGIPVTVLAAYDDGSDLVLEQRLVPVIILMPGTVHRKTGTCVLSHDPPQPCSR